MEQWLQSNLLTVVLSIFAAVAIVLRTEFLCRENTKDIEKNESRIISLETTFVVHVKDTNPHILCLLHGADLTAMQMQSLHTISADLCGRTHQDLDRRLNEIRDTMANLQETVNVVSHAVAGMKSPLLEIQTWVANKKHLTD